MIAIIVGGGRTGSHLAGELINSGHEVAILEQNPIVFEKLATEISARSFQSDGCDPEELERAGAAQADLVVAMTGDDEDNLVISWLAKYIYKVARVVARVNHPRNRWLFTREWGVDVAVSAAHIISKIIEEGASLGELVTLLKLREGKVALVEMILPPDSRAAGKRVKDIDLPEDSVLVTILRDGRILIPAAKMVLEPRDEILAVTSVAGEKALVDMIGAKRK